MINGRLVIIGLIIFFVMLLVIGICQNNKQKREVKELERQLNEMIKK